MNIEFVFTVVGVVANGAVTWGIISTKLDWLRRDLDEALKRITAIEARKQ